MSVGRRRARAGLLRTRMRVPAVVSSVAEDDFQGQTYGTVEVYEVELLTRQGSVGREGEHD